MFPNADIFWERWFAWYPVRLDGNGWVWLRWVQRRWRGWDYSDGNPFIIGHYHRRIKQERSDALADFPEDFLHEAKSVMDSLKFAPPELETLHFGRLAEISAELYAWNPDAGTVLAVTLLHKSKTGLQHLIDELEKSKAER